MTGVKIMTSIDQHGAVLKLRDVTKTYVMGAEEIHALSGVSLDLVKNEYIAIMGPSGSGKSTCSSACSARSVADDWPTA